jgi:Ca2+-binding RTX toxin-like protein
MDTGTVHVDCGEGNDTVLFTPRVRERQAANRLDTRRLGFTGCEHFADETAPAPRLEDFAATYQALGVPWDDEVVQKAVAYEELSSCQRKRQACPGSGADERIIGLDSADLLRGLGGSDFLEGAGGDDRLYGGDGDDYLFGRTGDDRLFGGRGADELEGGRGADVLVGGLGGDQLNGGLGPDHIYGGPQDDTIRAVGGGRDVIDCGPGRDRVEKDRRDRTRNCEIVL